MEKRSDEWLFNQRKYEAILYDCIKKFKWMRWEHIDWTGLGFSRKTAYRYELHLSEKVKGMFTQNRSAGVNYLLQKWIKSQNATLQIAAMRLMASEDDRQRLNQHYVDVTTKGKAFSPIDYSKLSDEALQEIHKAVKPDENTTDSE